MRRGTCVKGLGDERHKDVSEVKKTEDRMARMQGQRGGAHVVVVAQPKSRLHRLKLIVAVEMNLRWKGLE